MVHSVPQSRQAQVSVSGELVTQETSSARSQPRDGRPDGQPLHSFRGLLEHMATLTRNTITLAQTTFDKIT
jgi:hypothetical protein